MYEITTRGEDVYIRLTRGDSFYATISIVNKDGTQYIPDASDRIHFAVKQSYRDNHAVVTKSVPIDTLLLSLRPSDTTLLTLGEYVFDVKLTKENGDVYTFISGEFILEKR